MMNKMSYVFFIFLAPLLFVTFPGVAPALWCQELYLDQFIGTVYDYTEIDDHGFLSLRLPPPGGVLDLHYSYTDQSVTPAPWGAGFYLDFENDTRKFCNSTKFNAVQIEIKGDGSFNTFHFELVETKTTGTCGDGETWTSPNVSLSDTAWNTMIIPLGHFRRLSDLERRPGIDDYIEGDSKFVANIARYQMILTGKVTSDSSRHIYVREFKAIFVEPVAPLLPMIDDFELNSSIPYPTACGSSLPTIQYNFARRMSNHTSLQLYFNPIDPLSFEQPSGSGGIRIRLPKHADLKDQAMIQFHLKGDGSNNAVALELVLASGIEPDYTVVSPQLLLADTSWREIRLPLRCLIPEIYFSASPTSSLRLTGFNFLFSGSEFRDEKRDFIFIDALQCFDTVAGKAKIHLPMIDSFEDLHFCLEKFGPGNLSWSQSTKATTGNFSLALTYEPNMADSIANNWGAGVRRIFPEDLDLRFYDVIEFDLAGNGSRDSVRLELVESLQAPADGETWASDFFALDRIAWQQVKLDLDRDLRLLKDRTDTIYPDYRAGNQVRNHQFREYRLVFIGQDSKPGAPPILLDNVRVSSAQIPDHDTIIDSLVLSEPRYSPWRGNLLFHYRLKEPAGVLIKIYRMDGEQIAEIRSNGRQEAGTHTLEWNGTSKHGELLPNGLYLAIVKIQPANGPEINGLNHPKFIEILK